MKTFLVMTRDASGIEGLAREAAETFGMRLMGDAESVAVLAGFGLEASLLPCPGVAYLEDPDNEVCLVASNFLPVAAATRGFDSWKRAMQELDSDRVDAMRAAARLPDRMAVLGGAEDFAAAAVELAENKGRVSRRFALERSVRALRAASEFDFSVAQYLEIQGGESPDMAALSGYPKAQRFAWPRALALKHGANLHQQAAVYGSFDEHFTLHSGPGFDFDAVETLSRAAYFIGEFERPAAGLFAAGRLLDAATAADCDAAVELLAAGDDVCDAWLVVNGSIGAANLRAALAAGIRGVLAPDFSSEEAQILGTAEGVRAVTAATGFGYEALQELRSVAGGVVVQDRDRSAINPMEWTVQGRLQPLVSDWEDLVFAAKLARHLGSTAMAVVKDGRMRAKACDAHRTGVCLGQLAGTGESLEGALLVSDTVLSPGDLAAIKALGVRAALAPFGEGMDVLTEEANEEGLCFLSSPRGLRC